MMRTDGELNSENKQHVHKEAEKKKDDDAAGGFGQYKEGKEEQGWWDDDVHNNTRSCVYIIGWTETWF